jgi:hypothetical protein
MNLNCCLIEKVCYVCRPLENKTSLIDKIEVFPSFPYDEQSKSSAATAKKWGTYSYYDYNSKQTVNTVSTLSVEDNNPIKVQIISLEVRSEGGRAYGGRAYKVIDEKNRMFDLREDQLIEAIALYGIEAGGMIGGLFQWGKDGSQMKLASVGGKLHTDMVKNKLLKDNLEKKRAAGELFTPAKCKPGYIYSRGNSLFLFLGAGKFPHKNKNLYFSFEINKADNKPYWLSDYKDGKYIEKQNIKPWETATWNERISMIIEHHSGLSINMQSSFSPFVEEIESIDNSLLKEIKDLVFLRKHISSYSMDEEKYDTINPKPSYNNYGGYGYSSTSTSEKQKRLYNIAIENWYERQFNWFFDGFTWK